MSASLAGKQRTNAVKIYWSTDQKLIVVCHVPSLYSQKNSCDISTTCAIYYASALCQNMVNVEKFKCRK